MEHSFDVVVVGAGPGGYVSAIRAAQLGLKVAIVEKDKLGGVCLNWGCIPTKALLKTAETLKTIQHAADFGIEIQGTPKIDLKKIVARSRAASSQLSRGIEFLMKKNGVTVFNGHARLQGGKTVLVEGSDKKVATLTSKNIVLATGARARLMPDLKMDPAFFWTAHEAMIPETLPKSLLILGSGAIGIEFASFYRTLGVAVTVVEMLPRILPQEDAEISTLAQKSFEKQGIEILTNTQAKGFKVEKNQVHVTLERAGKTETRTAEKALLAIGVVANTENLGLESTRIKIEKGRVVTDATCETAEPGVYAIGDLTAGPWLAHKASHEGVMVAEKIKGMKTHALDVTKIPGCTYSLPQIASIGLTEEKAKEAGYTVKVGRFPFSANGKAVAMGENEGLIKTIFDDKTGEVLGAHMIGSEVTELINTFALARTLEATEAEMMETVFPHPTLSEMIHESVLNAFGRALHT